MFLREALEVVPCIPDTSKEFDYKITTQYQKVKSWQTWQRANTKKSKSTLVCPCSARGKGGEEEVQWSIVIYINYCPFFLNQSWQELHLIISIILSALLGLALSLHIYKFISASLNHISCYNWQRANPGLGEPSTATRGASPVEHRHAPKGRGFSSGISQEHWVPCAARRP